MSAKNEPFFTAGTGKRKPVAQEPWARWDQARQKRNEQAQKLALRNIEREKLKALKLKQKKERQAARRDRCVCCAFLHAQLNAQRILRQRRRALVQGGYTAIKNRRNKVITNPLGCTPTTFQRHVEAQLKPGMAWENYRTVWALEQIAGADCFDLASRKDRRKWLSYRNLKPVFV